MLSIIKSILLLNKKFIPFLKSNSKLNFIYKESKKIFQFNKKELIDDYFSNFSPRSPKYNNYINIEKNRIKNFLSLETLSKKKNEPFNEKIKQKLLRRIIALSKKNLTKLDTIYIKETIPFGNAMISINHIIYYCEVLGCKNIYFNPQINWYIKNKIVTEKLNISLNSQVNCSDPTILCISLRRNFWYYLVIIKPEIRINIIKNEIKRNLPQLKIDKDDLYIHIRVNNHIHYAQPPLCFYETIINNFKFKNIYLISGNRSTRLIEKLVSEYPNVIFQKNSKEVDISYLSNAYNLVGSISSFFEVSVKLNDNLKNLFIFDIYKNIVRILFLHYDFYYYPRKYTIYQMKTSIDYRKKMFIFKMSPEQDQYMIEEKCPNSFEIIIF